MINIIGLGYIGLPTALMFAASGNQIVGTDINKETVQKLQNGELPFEEKGMAELYEQAVEAGIEFTTEYQETDMYIVTVPTPYDRETKKIDPSYVIEASKTVLDHCKPGATLVIESTVSPGTIDKYVRPAIEEHGYVLGEDVHLVHAPERILPGNMIHELRYNSRTVGADEYEAGERVKAIYETFCKSDIVITDIRTAEMTKVVENTYRDINIAFANELALISQKSGLDVYEIIRISNMHPRVNILNPGPGVGGHCISVDPWFLVGDYPLDTPLIQTARQINDEMPAHVLERIRTLMQKYGINDASKVGLYGLTYKQNVDDTRESPTLQLLEMQRKHLAPELKVFDPWVKEQITQNQYFDFEQFLEDVELVVVMVSHDHIKENEAALTDKVVLDTQNCLNNIQTYTI